jgi:hypothetical protein
MTALVSRLPATWRNFASFLRKPAFGQPSGLRSRAAWQTVGAMLALHLLGLGALLVLLSGWQSLTGIDGPAAFDAFPKHWLLPMAVLAAPLLEESIFRGWLSGRPRALWLLGCFLVAAVVLVTIKAEPLHMLAGLLAGLVIAVGGWIALRKRLAPAWFERRFSAIFFAAAVVFGLIHVFNYSAPGLLHLPMVLPQIWAGLTLGFVRTRVGLPASMLLHGTSNGLALGLVALGG